jgi:GNAT superfamily N-acetyltransferase
MSGADHRSAPRLAARFSAQVGELEIRSAATADFDELERLLAFLVDPVDRQPASRRVFLRMLADPRRMVLVALLDARMVGTLDLIVVDNPTHNGAPWAAIENVVVDPEQRRRGVARALLASALELAKAAGCYKVQLVSGTGRSEAHPLYEEMGFDSPVRGFRRYL